MKEDYTITFHAPPKKSLPRPLLCVVFPVCAGVGGGGGVRRPRLCISRVNCGHHHAGSPCLSHVRGAGSRVKLGSVIRPVLVIFLLFDITVWILKVSFTFQCNHEAEYMLIKFLLYCEQVTTFTDNL